MIDPEDGQLRTVKAHGTVAALYLKGALSDRREEAVAMRSMADTFAANFYLAGLVGYRTSNPEPRSRGSGDRLTEQMVAASRWIHWALSVVGGVDSLAGSVLWHVVGLGESLNGWASKAPVANGAPGMRQSTATFVLVAALQALVAARTNELTRLGQKV